MNEVSVVCVRSDKYYAGEYVNRLYRGVKRNLTVPHEFICIAGDRDGIDPEINCVEPMYGLKTWWPGMVMYQSDPPYVSTRNVLTLGLDCVIVGSLDDLVNFPSDFAVNKDYPSFSCPPGHEADGNCEVQLIRNGKASLIWDAYVALGMPNWDMQDYTVPRPMRMQAMEVINGPNAKIRADLFPEHWVISYKIWVRTRGIPEGCKIVSFHGQPKMAQVVDSEAWVKEHWI
jgi:hypothetical protein